MNSSEKALGFIKSGYSLINENSSIYKRFNSTIYRLLTLEYQDLEKLPLPYLRNSDLFFACLKSNSSLNYNYLNCKPRDFLTKFLSESICIVRDSDKIFKESVSTYIDYKSDQLLGELKALSIDSVDRFDDSEIVIYSKINHGYWEFFLNSYVSSPSGCRDLSASQYSNNWRKFGFHELLKLSFEENSVADNPVKIGVSLTAGEDTIERSYKKVLNDTSRGALIGLLSFLKSTECVTPLTNGTHPRNLVKNNKLNDFIDKINTGNDCIVLLVPQSLSGIILPSVSKPIYKVVVPAQVVHETAEIVLAFLMGAIEDLRTKYENISILSQAAVFSPIAAIMLNRIFGTKNVSFYDLGRVLDLSRPELYEKWPSLAKIAKNTVEIDKILQYEKEDQVSLLKGNTW